MLDQDHIQKTIRAYVSASLIVKSEVISPNTQRYLRDVMKTEIISLRKDESSPAQKAA